MMSEKNVSYIPMISRAPYLYLVRGEIKRSTKQLEMRPPSSNTRNMPNSVKLHLFHVKETKVLVRGSYSYRRQALHRRV